MVRAATQADPAWRTPTMAALRDALGKAVAPEEVSLATDPVRKSSPLDGVLPPEAPPPEAPAPEGPDYGRLGLGAAVVLVAAGLGASFFFGGGEEDPSPVLVEETYPGQPPRQSPHTDRGAVPTEVPLASGEVVIAPTRTRAPDVPEVTGGTV